LTVYLDYSDQTGAPEHVAKAVIAVYLLYKHQVWFSHGVESSFNCVNSDSFYHCR